jgi:hypothetical protein
VLTERATVPFSALKRQNAATPTATVHTDADAGRVVFSRAGTGRLLALRLAIVNTIGSIAQARVSE